MTHTLYTTRHGKASECIQAAVISALVRPVSTTPPLPSRLAPEAVLQKAREVSR